MDGGFERINTAPAYQLVAEAIEREILSGRIRIGEHIGTETQLVQQLGVNRSTVREGIRLLEQSGLLVRDSRRRLLAAVPGQEELANRISRALVLQQVSFRELWEGTRSTEPALAELAAQRAPADLVAQLAANISATASALDDPEQLLQLDIEFHSLVAQASGNRILMLAREPMSLLAAKATELLFAELSQAPAQLLEAHTRIYEAIRDGDQAEARAWMRRHIESFRRGFELAELDFERPVGRLYLDHFEAQPRHSGAGQAERAARDSKVSED